MPVAVDLALALFCSTSIVASILAIRKAKTPPIEKTTGGLVKLTVNISGPDWDAVVRMAERKGLTKTEVIRRAIGTEAHLFDLVEQKNKILVKYPNDTYSELIFK